MIYLPSGSWFLFLTVDLDVLCFGNVKRRSLGCVVGRAAGGLAKACKRLLLFPMLLNSATLSGKGKGDIVLLESDERYAAHSFQFFHPTHFVITNLYRDQLTRNAHPFHIYHIIADAVKLIPNAQLVLNADDPIVRNFGYGRENVEYFGMARNGLSTAQTDAVTVRFTVSG